MSVDTECGYENPSQEAVEKAMAEHSADKNAFLNGTLDPAEGDPFENEWRDYLPLC
jgi:hypothetical protein